MTDKEYVCAYPHCLHHGEKVKASESVVVGKKHYHWDCAALRQEIEELRNVYWNRIDNKVTYSVLSKVLNDLVFKYGLETDYIKFAINHFADCNTKVKSPFTLLYLRDNRYLKEKWEKFKGR